jgi:hypothetical protein
MTQLIVTPDSAGITDVPGFEAAGVACDIREKHDLKRLDLALLFSLRPCTAAGTFTKNAVKAAPVLLCTKHLAHGGPFHGIVANSGNANACTGPDGLQDAHTTAQRIAASLNLKPTSFFVCSTGRIGQPLPMPKLLKGLERHPHFRHQAQDRHRQLHLRRQEALRLRHRQGSRHDPAEHGHDARLPRDGLFRAAQLPAKNPLRGGHRHLQLHHGGWRHEHQRHGAHAGQRPLRRQRG